MADSRDTKPDFYARSSCSEAETVVLLMQARAQVVQSADNGTALASALADAFAAATDIAHCLALASNEPDADTAVQYELLRQAYASARAVSSSVRFALFCGPHQ